MRKEKTLKEKTLKEKTRKIRNKIPKNGFPQAPIKIFEGSDSSDGSNRLRTQNFASQRHACDLMARNTFKNGCFFSACVFRSCATARICFFAFYHFLIFGFFFGIDNSLLSDFVISRLGCWRCFCLSTSSSVLH